MPGAHRRHQGREAILREQGRGDGREIATEAGQARGGAHERPRDEGEDRRELPGGESPGGAGQHWKLATVTRQDLLMIKLHNIR